MSLANVATYIDIINELVAARNAEHEARLEEKRKAGNAWAAEQDRMLRPIMDLLSEIQENTAMADKLWIRARDWYLPGKTMKVLAVSTVGDTEEVRRRAYNGELTVYLVFGADGKWHVTLKQTGSIRDNGKTLATVPVDQINMLMPPLLSQIADMVREVA